MKEQQQQQQQQQQTSPSPWTLPSLTDFIITEQEEEQLNKAASAALSSLSGNSGGGGVDDENFEVFDPEPIRFGGTEIEGEGGSLSAPEVDEFSSLLLNLSEDQDFVDALLAIGEDSDGNGNVERLRHQQNQQLDYTDGHNTKQVDTETNDDNTIFLQQIAEGGNNQQENPQTSEGDETTSSSNSLPEIEINFGSEPFLLDDPASLNTVFDEEEGAGNAGNVQEKHQHPSESEEEIHANSSTSTAYFEASDEGKQEEEEELLRQFVESLVLNETAIDEGKIAASVDTSADFEPDNLLDDLAKLNLFKEKSPYLGEMDDILNNGGDMGGNYDNGSSDESLPPGMYPYCLPCSVQPSQYIISAGIEESALAHNAIRRQPQHQPHQLEQKPQPESFPSANTGILTSITEGQPFVQRSQEEAKTELQALYAASRRQKQHEQKQQGNAGTIDEYGTERHGKEEAIRIDHIDPQAQDMKEAMNNVEPKMPGWWEVADQWCTGFGVDLRHEIGLIAAADDDDCKPRVGNSSSGRSAEKTCMGHKETIYGVTFSPDGKWLATASQDSSIAIWEVDTHRLVTMLQGHSKAYECLRVDWAGLHWSNETLDRERFRNLIASSGADGIVKVWSSAKPNAKDGWKCEFTLDHAKLLNRGVNNKPKSGSFNNKGGDDDGDGDGDENLTPVEEEDKPQVYSLQFINHWKVFTDEMHELSKDLADDQNSFLMTSSDEFIHLWEVEKHPFDQQLVNSDQQKIRILQDSEIKLKEVMSLHFGSIDQYGYGVTPCSITGDGLQLPPPPLCSKHKQGNDSVSREGHEGNFNFGGERNPLNIVYVFDAAYCCASGLLGVALSDGSLRLVNGRGTCVSILNLPGGNSHLTALAWDRAGSRLATTVATGHVIVWSLDIKNEQGGRHESMVATCRSIYEGGHEAMRPVFGARFVGDDVGGENKDSDDDDQSEKLLASWGVDGRLCLWDSYALGNIYSPIAMLKNDPEYPIYAVDVSGRHVAVGGGSDGGFIGTPVYLFDIPSTR